MSRDFPDWIDVARACEAGRCFGGRLPLAWMPRLIESLAEPAADEAVDFEITAMRDENAVARFEVHVSGRLPLICQRSLERYHQSIDSNSSVAVVESERALDGLPEDLEPKLVPEGRMKLVELVEDELLLALPLVPINPASEPIETVAGSASEDGGQDHAEQGPFAVLEKLRRQD
ncbi:MAG: YceD family protein [Wenzhouxiangellaceae bacterium]